MSEYRVQMKDSAMIRSDKILREFGATIFCETSPNESWPDSEDEEREAKGQESCERSLRGKTTASLDFRRGLEDCKLPGWMGKTNEMK